MTTIGVVGYGVVGKAVANGFFKRSGYQIFVNDALPSRSAFTKTQLTAVCDSIFVCVSTPKCDMKNVFDAVEELDSHRGSSSPIVVVKSTITVGTTRKLTENYPDLKLAYNPEFLREKHAKEDFLYPDRIIIGSTSDELSRSVGQLYRDWPCRAERCYVTPEQAEMAKLLSNAYLVYKVAFGLEGERLCKSLGVEDAKTVLQLVGMDSRIGWSHLDPTMGKIPNNSPCLPKDLRALLSQADSSLLRRAYEEAVE